MTDRDTDYWNRVGYAWNARQQRLWRIHSDNINRAVLDRWLPETRIESVLKTDLFDEMSADGIYPYLASRARNTVGTDISPATLFIARSRNEKIRGVAADVRRLPFAGGSFNLIFSNSTLDHFDCTQQIHAGLSELIRVLCPGGYLLITMDNPANPIVALRNALPFSILKRMGVIPYYVGKTLSMQKLKNGLESMGLEVLHVKAIMHSPRLIAVVLARLLDRFAAPRLQKVFLRILMFHEVLALLPTSSLTGYFTAVWAVKRAG